jgi:beta-galactosidase/beta-glucuronidase
MDRSEYPRPQFVRKDWLCLNGEWEFEIDAADTGLERGLRDRPLRDRIRVPFCPESALSGIGNVDFMNAVWYRRTLEVPKEWSGRKVLLHFQAVDYDATVWVNGMEVGRHRGGFTPFTCDLGGAAEPGATALIVVRARDPKGQVKPQGKQSPRYENYGCCYTRTTGIWQTVWMEPVPLARLERTRITPDVAGGRFRLVQPLTGNPRGFRVRAALRDGKGEVARAEARADADLSPQLDLAIPEGRVRLWEPASPHLYDLDIELVDAGGAAVDSFRSYAGLRSVGIDGRAVRLNGRTVFQRLVLDQGYYPDGLMTAPSDEALRRDIEISMAAGFNGARLHQKVFEERFLYHADRLGDLCWGEFGDWCYADHNLRDAAFVAQWCEAVQRDYSHPCIVGWCPQNETAQPMEERIVALDDVTRAMYLTAKLADPTRPILDASGYAHRVRECEIYDSHNYEQDPARFREQNAGSAAGKPFANLAQGKPESLPYAGQPYFVSEFGGIWWNPRAKEGEASWGYGNRPRSLEEFHARFQGLCGALLDDPSMFGYCYTQLTDVFQEQNGIVFFDRTPKFDLDRLRRVQERRAAIEEPDGRTP